MAGNERGRLLRLVQGNADQPERSDALAAVARAAAAGDRKAQRTLLLTIGPHLLRVARRVLGARHPDVDDVAQESAFAVMDALPGHRGECTVLSFVCRIAALTALNVRRRELTQKRKSARDDGFELEQLVASSPAPDEAVLAQASAELVRRLLDALPIEQAEVLALHCVLGFTAAEVAEASGAPLETVRSRLKLAKAALRVRVLADPRLSKWQESS